MDVFAGLTILSLEQATVAPYLTYRLAQDGARVVRLEHPGQGDPNRRIGDNRLGEEGMNTYFLCINAGKQALTLDLGGPEGREILKRLVAGLAVDVFVTNQLPKNYTKLGIDYETLKSVRPDIVWVGVTGFGPERDEAAYDPILQARGGLMELTGEPDGPPQVLGIPLPDMGTSEHAYGQIYKALFRRAITGQGARVDISMLESTTSWLTVPITLSQSFGRRVGRRGNTHEFFAPVSVYPTADGYVYLAVGNDKQWSSLVRLPGFAGLDEPDLRANAGRIAKVGELNRRLAEITRRQATSALIDLMKPAGLAVSKISDIGEVARDPYVAPALMRSRDPRTGAELVLAPPPVSTEFLGRRGRTLSFPPRLGEHNDEIYGGVLGLGPAELADLRARGII